MSDLIAIGDVIRRRREALRLSQAELGWFARVSRNTIGNLERNQGEPEQRTRRDVGAVLGLDIEVSDDPERTPQLIDEAAANRLLDVINGMSEATARRKAADLYVRFVVAKINERRLGSWASPEETHHVLQVLIDALAPHLSLESVADAPVFEMFRDHGWSPEDTERLAWGAALNDNAAGDATDTRSRALKAADDRSKLHFAEVRRLLDDEMEELHGHPMHRAMEEVRQLFGPQDDNDPRNLLKDPRQLAVWLATTFRESQLWEEKYLEAKAIAEEAIQAKAEAEHEAAELKIRLDEHREKADAFDRLPEPLRDLALSPKHVTNFDVVPAPGRAGFEIATAIISDHLPRIEREDLIAGIHAANMLMFINDVVEVAYQYFKGTLWGAPEELRDELSNLIARSAAQEKAGQAHGWLIYPPKNSERVRDPGEQ